MEVAGQEIQTNVSLFEKFSLDYQITVTLNGVEYTYTAIQGRRIDKVY